MPEYYRAIHKILERYRDIYLERDLPQDDLWDLIMASLFSARDEIIPLMKLNRHVGYIQGVLIERGLSTIEYEREWTRPLLRPLDFGDSSEDITSTSSDCRGDKSFASRKG